ncbi:MAG: hypothetical protein IT254_03935 [Chitinophagaceae bacterium]|nr:hypothetical protein [Bacteroidota bacterium]MCC6257448.1 hypothetical protein [Chitinophagaceae bacterium]MCW5916519.1 hypothetical protein [Ferruginibacter sp.]
MPKSDVTNRLKRLRNHYRLVVMNEDSYEEVVQFKLTRWSVYVVLSAVFIIMIALTASLIIFTPLKYYLPGSGYGDARQMKEYRDLKIRTDSMERAMLQQNQYFTDLEKVLQGKVKPRDTTRLKMPKLEDFDD